uniref:Uncharacterized protein n=1 Tax=Arion vulgaris TaxID=1028688 RepID=A0A0B7B4D8_9EUPU
MMAILSDTTCAVDQTTETCVAKSPHSKPHCIRGELLTAVDFIIRTYLTVQSSK